ncbi:TetR/AcrR family transcriptional regulator [Cryptosporangium phraense]|uniref:TetR/AcrR family transcriptional regulator n=1 Tax=Cryptosporangium phraense TaxID=2593070 RepID=A0A545AMZ1_9ACTN|nr:TetR/AcrR family transcriptional regulator [Cryptosporangium phraense]TQS42656.1 TetR/AcrR family transcriptional regulator [Cryptosporangium phraense]
MRGRPRDPGVEARIAAAALTIYGDQGWAGFNFEAVARAADVSRDSLYRRWKDRRELLVAAMSRVEPPPTPVDGLSLRDTLLRTALSSLERYLAPGGNALLRLYVEAPQDPELLELFHREVITPAVRRTRQLVRDAIEAGHLPADANPTAIIDSVFGAVLMHVVATPAELRPKMIEQAEEYVTEVVDLTLRGAHYDDGR